METLFYINFGGFYNSQHSENIDQVEENYELDWEQIDYKKTHINYSKKYVKMLNNLMGLSLKFKELDSPKFYNFTTDKIGVYVSNKDYKKLIKAYLDQDLKDYINQNSKSYDGFTSFYSGFDAVYKQKDIFLQYLFDYIIKEKNINDNVYDHLDSDLIYNEIIEFNKDHNIEILPH